MSKSQSRKGYAVGALVALVSSLFTFAPAQADATGPMTLLPTSGTTFNTLIGSTISLATTQEPSTVVAGKRTATTSYYIIDNPGNARIQISFGSANENDASESNFVWHSFNSSGVASAGSSTSSGTTTVAQSISNTTLNHYTVITSLSKIAVNAGAAPAVNAAYTLNTLELNVIGDTTATLGVTVLNDYNGGSAGTSTTDLINNPSLFDLVSATETVKIYAPGDVTAVTSITGLVPGQDTFSATVVYGSDINPSFVFAKTALSIYKNGSLVALDTDATDIVVDSGAKVQAVYTSSTGTSISAGVISFGVTSSDAVSFNDVLDGETPPTWSTAVYSAQAFYQTASTYVTVGAASAALNNNAGPSTTADGLSVSHVATLDTAYTLSGGAATVSARTGTTAITLNTQVMSGSAELSFANIEVKAVISEVALAAASSITSTGATGALVADGDAITAIGRTNADGEASFTITSNNGTADDQVSVAVYFKNSAGVWAAATETTVIAWEDASWTESQFVATPAFISGATPSVTFTAKDQFGRGITTIDDAALTVYVVASFGGVSKPASYSATAVVDANGAATFTFANFAPTGGLAQLKASLLAGGISSAVSKGEATVNVYNSAATGEIAVASSFATDVTYVDYVVGDTDDAAVAAQVAAAGLASADGVTISANVLNANGVGQPGVLTTLTAEGVLFRADGEYSLGTVTLNANEYGTVDVFAITHTAAPAGATVSISADGLSATTLLVSSLPTGLAAANLNLSWAMPANVVKNTTYAVTATLTDKWGNPIQTVDAAADAVTFQGLGAVEINSSASGISRNFDRNGQATVFLRSIKDIAGPGSVTATLASTFDYYGADATAVSSSTIVASILTDVASTAWDESAWSNALTSEIEVLDAAPAAAQKVNAGSFKGYVAVYAKGYEGSRLSAKVGKDWVIVPSIPAATNDLYRYVEFTGAGVDVAVRIYIDRVLVDTINLTTK